MHHGFHTISKSVHALPLVFVQFLGIKPLWEILSSTIANYIWKARCSLIFHQVRASLTELVKCIWDCTVGDSDNKAAQRHQFLTL